MMTKGKTNFHFLSPNSAVNILVVKTNNNPVLISFHLFFGSFIL